jgi:hypothetical protein
VRLEFHKKRMTFASGESPFEGLRGPLVSVLEGLQRPPRGTQVVAIRWCEQLTLNGREVDFDLVEPAGMDRGMYQDGVVPFGPETFGGPRAAVGRAVAGDEIHPMRGPIGFRRHDLRDKALEGSDAGLALATPEQSGPMHIQRGEIRQGAGPCIFVLDADRTPRAGGQRAVFAAPGLNAGLLVDAENVITSSQRRWYSSRTRPALRANRGSRGKIHVRWRQGRNASWLSQRQSVVPLIAATMPLAMASWRSSDTGQRASGRPRRDGISQASALIATTILGGKADRASASRSFIES